MGKFKDTKDREWEVDITIGTTIRLKSEGADFHSLVENRCAKFLALAEDDIGLAGWLWAIVKPQATASGVSEEDFYEALSGETLHAAWEVFASATADFIRNPEIRCGLKEALAKSKKIGAKAADAIRERFNRLEELANKRLAAKTAEMSDERLTKMLDEGMASAQQKPNEPSGASLAS